MEWKFCWPEQVVGDMCGRDACAVYSLGYLPFLKIKKKVDFQFVLYCFFFSLKFFKVHINRVGSGAVI